MLKTLTALTLVVALTGGGLAAAGLIGNSGERADCPGKIICPITGELVCKDRCPLGEAEDAGLPAELPACCRNRK